MTHNKMSGVWVLFYLALSIFITSCGEDDPPIDVDNCPQAAVGKMIAENDSADWGPASATASTAGSVLVISASTPTGSTIQLSANSLSAGTYSLTGGQATFIPGGASITAFVSNAGTLQITAYSNNKVSGDFEFTGTAFNATTGQQENHTITCGSFTDVSL